MSRELRSTISVADIVDVIPHINRRYKFKTFIDKRVYRLLIQELMVVATNGSLGDNTTQALLVAMIPKSLLPAAWGNLCRVIDQTREATTYELKDKMNKEIAHVLATARKPTYKTDYISLHTLHTILKKIPADILQIMQVGKTLRYHIVSNIKRFRLERIESRNFGGYITDEHLLILFHTLRLARTDIGLLMDNKWEDIVQIWIDSPEGLSI